MCTQGKALFVAMAAAISIAESAGAGGLNPVATIPIPGTPVNAFGGLTIDQGTGLGYLADKDSKAVVVFDTKTNKYLSRINGFVGLTKNGDASGPNNAIVVNNGAELWVSDGDSTIKIVDLKTGTVTGSLATGGKVRTNAMAYDPNGRIVIVANSNEEPPFLNLISTEPGHKILAKIPITQSAENIERSAFHAPSGMFYTVMPVFASDKSKGLIAQTDAKSGKLVKLHEIERCHPHSLSIVSDTTIFLGCSNGHGSSPKPGGDMAILDIPSGKVEGYGADLGGNGGSAVNLKLGHYYHATSTAAIVVIDIKSRALIQKTPTSNGARSLDVNLTSNRVYLATTAKDGPCGGCIQVFEPQ